MSNIKNIPEKIYLQIGDECPDDADFNELSEVSWCKDKIYDNDIEFTLQNKVSEKCKHKSLADTGAGYYYCPDCDYRWTYSEYEEEENEVSDISADKFYKLFKDELLLKCDRLLRDKGMSGAESNECNFCISKAIDAVENQFKEYASIVNERKDSAGSYETSNEVLNEVLGIAVKAHLFQQLNQMDDFIEEMKKFENFEIKKK